MLKSEIIAHIKHLQVMTRRALTGVQSGNYKTPQKGDGFEFDQLRAYQPGDDVRTIDWHATARMDSMMVRQYVQEKQRIFWLLVDCSSSMFYSSTGELKYHVAANVAGALALMAEKNNDLVGLVLYAGDIEILVPPKSGKLHVHYILEKLFSVEVQMKKTSNLSHVLQKFAARFTKRSIVVICSDGLDELDKNMVLYLQKTKQVCFLRCIDEQEKQFAISAMMWMQDLETGKYALQKIHKKTRVMMQSRADQQKRFLKNQGIGVVDIMPQRDYIQDLVQFFSQRIVY